ncbi:MAG: 6-phosphofructokinase, partial [Elusimicrobia bacterium]|nr:6-phosphofructokinase [Candidatus Obscuribacterium magneticum]
MSRYIRELVLNTFQEKFVLPSITRVLVFIFIFTNIAFAHKPQESVWSERRKNQEMQLASLPAHMQSQTLMNLPRPQINEQLLRRLPGVSPHLTSPSPSLIAERKKSQPRIVSALPDRFFPCVNVRDVYQGQGKLSVVLLEDVHLNKEAQLNLSQAIKSLGEGPDGESVLVGLEGASGGFFYDVYKAFPDRDIATRVADSFLETGEISGPAHAGFTSYRKEGTRGLSFWGVDDNALYLRNVEAYRKSSPIKKGTKSRLASLQKDVEGKKAKAFNPALLQFDARVKAYRGGSLSLAPYLKILAGAGVQPSLATETFLQAYDMESSMNFSLVEAERRRVLEQLVRRAAPKDLESLIQMSLSYQEGTVTFADYYRYLKDLGGRYGIDLARTPHFDDYIRYVLLTDSIKADVLYKDMRSLEEGAYNDLAENQIQKDLISLSRQIYLAQELVDYRLTTDQWEQYEGGRKLLAGTIDLSAFEEFYQVAEARSQTMVKNLLSVIPMKGVIPAEAGIQSVVPTNVGTQAFNMILDSGFRRNDELAPQFAVLVSGGFHTQGLTEQLKKQGVSYIVASPKITKLDLDNEVHYLSVFDREKTPLEQMFAGKKLFLVGTPAGAINPADPNQGRKIVPIIFSICGLVGASVGYITGPVALLMKKTLGSVPRLVRPLKGIGKGAVFTFILASRVFKVLINLPVGFFNRLFFNSADHRSVGGRRITVLTRRFTLISPVLVSKREESSSHAFRTISGFIPAVVATAFASALLYGVNFQPSPLNFSIQIVAVVFWLWTALPWFFLGLGTFWEMYKFDSGKSSFLKRSFISFFSPIATSAGHRSPAHLAMKDGYLKRRVDLHESFKNHAVGLFAMLPGLSFFARRYLNGVEREIHRQIESTMAPEINVDIIADRFILVSKGFVREAIRNFQPQEAKRPILWVGQNNGLFYSEYQLSSGIFKRSNQFYPDELFHVYEEGYTLLQAGRHDEALLRFVHVLGNTAEELVPFQDAILKNTVLMGLSGGDCAGLNTALAASTEELAKNKVLQAGVLSGFEGLAVEPAAFLKRLGFVRSRETPRLKQWATFEFKSSRAKVTDKNKDNMVANASRFRGLILIGGDDHSKEANKLAQLLPEAAPGISVPVVAIPKSVDNDIPTKMLGAMTAARDEQRAFYSQGATAKAHDRISINESQGRDAGWYALLSAHKYPDNFDSLSEGERHNIENTRDGVMILIPEKPAYLRDVLLEGFRIFMREGFLNVQMSEGFLFQDFNIKEHRKKRDTLFYRLLDIDGELREKFAKPDVFDPHENPKLAGIHRYLFLAFFHLVELAEHDPALKELLQEFSKTHKDPPKILEGTRSNEYAYTGRGVPPSRGLSEILKRLFGRFAFLLWFVRNKVEDAEGEDYILGLRYGTVAAQEVLARHTSVIVTMAKFGDPRTAPIEIKRIVEVAIKQKVTDVFSDDDLRRAGVFIPGPDQTTSGVEATKGIPPNATSETGPGSRRIVSGTNRIAPLLIGVIAGLGALIGAPSIASAMMVVKDAAVGVGEAASSLANLEFGLLNSCFPFMFGFLGAVAVPLWFSLRRALPYQHFARIKKVVWPKPLNYDEAIERLEEIRFGLGEINSGFVMDLAVRGQDVEWTARHADVVQAEIEEVHAICDVTASIAKQIERIKRDKAEAGNDPKQIDLVPTSVVGDLAVVLLGLKMGRKSANNRVLAEIIEKLTETEEFLTRIPARSRRPHRFVSGKGWMV